MDTNPQLGASQQIEITGLEVPQISSVSTPKRKGRYRCIKRLPTSPDLFPDGKTNRMASNKLIWEGCNILTQAKNLGWVDSEKGSLCYQSPVAKGQGYVSFWVSDDLHGLNPAVLEGEVALALIDQFDIRAACIHLIYAAHATQLDRPWEQQFVLSDTQLERYLGLEQNRNLKNKQEKLNLLLALAKQPCSLLMYVSWPEKGTVGAFSVSRTWLWEIAEPILHYQNCFHDEQGNPIGEKLLVGFTLKVRCGNWAQYFLNEEKRRNKSGYYEYGIVSSGVLRDLMSLWHHHEGAARLMTWLLFKTRVNRNSPLTVEMLMKVAFGEKMLDAAIASSKERKKLVRRWETTLKVLIERGWNIQPDPETYPPQYWPEMVNVSPLMDIPDAPEEAAEFWALDAASGEGTRLTDITKRTRGSFERLLGGRLWVHPPAEIAEKLDEIDKPKKPHPTQKRRQKAPVKSAPRNVTAPFNQQQDCTKLTGERVRELRIARGLSVTQLAELAEMGKSTVSMIETGKRSITPKTQKRLKQALGLSLPALRQSHDT
ncbi:helix-turn-helix transcriptional regulator [Microcoleus sp. FACHB-SPT15]|uniref:helix-turn-helix domain-containing protein n=1 Tax=Microcoleus sp. FACHB-SPT15 TaxID=2692830 RepID=UPI001783D4E0|nr:helix-turn-helix transcriptional regulator [Microcoleus sp. FACHB-SPT15]MBD1810038.1 helix-turn-helix transcriptional regulator [Microcoleus sp. FACHB-SPT15]